MDALWNFFVDLMGPLGPFFALGLVGLLLVIAAAFMFFSQPEDPMDRLNKRETAEKKKIAASKSNTPRLRLEDNGPNLEKFKTILEPQDKESFSAIQLKLIQAGYRMKSAVRTFHFAQFALALAGLFGGVLYASVLASDMSLQSVLIAILVPAGAGYYLPTYWIERRRQTRQANLEEAFPDALDLLLVCVEAGQSLDQSIQRVAVEMRTGFPDLAEEFETVANEMRAGKDRVSVLRDMGERAGAQDISSFVTVLIQSASFGTSISDALRIYSNEMRDKRVMRAEEKANTLPTKMTLGTMMFTLPPLLIILIGPSVYDIYVMLVVGQ